jgi:hypothetical protein
MCWMLPLHRSVYVLPACTGSLVFPATSAGQLGPTPTNNLQEKNGQTLIYLRTRTPEKSIPTKATRVYRARMDVRMRRFQWSQRLDGPEVITMRCKLGLCVVLA